MLKRINDLLNEQVNFAFKTTLSTKRYKNKIAEAKAKDYQVTLLFFWLQTTDLAKERVRTRVLEGGHHIDAAIIERRYRRGIKNLFDIYLPIADEVFLFDNTMGKQHLIAEKTLNNPFHVVDVKAFEGMQKYYNEY